MTRLPRSPGLAVPRCWPAASGRTCHSVCRPCGMVTTVHPMGRTSVCTPNAGIRMYAARLPVPRGIGVTGTTSNERVAVGPMGVVVIGGEEGGFTAHPARARKVNNRIPHLFMLSPPFCKRLSSVFFTSLAPFHFVSLPAMPLPRPETPRPCGLAMLTIGIVVVVI